MTIMMIIIIIMMIIMIITTIMGIMMTIIFIGGILLFWFVLGFVDVLDIINVKKNEKEDSEKGNKLKLSSRELK